MTYQEQLIKALTKLGYKQVLDTRQSKYLEFRHPEANKDSLFVGNRGALRYGRISTQSYSVGDPANQTPKYRQLLELANKP